MEAGAAPLGAAQRLGTQAKRKRISTRAQPPLALLHSPAAPRPGAEPAPIGGRRRRRCRPTPASTLPRHPAPLLDIVATIAACAEAGGSARWAHRRWKGQVCAQEGQLSAPLLLLRTGT